MLYEVPDDATKKRRVAEISVMRVNRSELSLNSAESRKQAIRQHVLDVYFLASMIGNLTPSGLHFERHHGAYRRSTRHVTCFTFMVGRRRKSTIPELENSPSITRRHFIECSGNTLESGRSDGQAIKLHTAFSMLEWTGVQLRRSHAPLDTLKDNAAGSSPRAAMQPL